jgi:hypothetical protein
VKHKRAGDTQLETGKLGSLSLKGLSAPVVTPELANIKMGVIAKVDAPISPIQVNSFSSLAQTPASEFDWLLDTNVGNRAKKQGVISHSVQNWCQWRWHKMIVEIDGLL